MHTFKRNAGDESACASRVGVRLRTLVAASTWLHIALPIGLGLPPSANAAGPETVTYIHTDALGSLVAESDANGNVIKRYDYEPYGTLVGGQVTDGPGYTACERLDYGLELHATAIHGSGAGSLPLSGPGLSV